jgi:LysM repeat protein
MTQRLFFAVAAAGVLLWSVGCSDRAAPLPPEMDEPYYAEAVQLARQGRNGEALTSFLKVIDKRGERGAPESHLEVASLYLNHTKDPVRAYYHFSRYLELQPNSKEAPRVRNMLDASLREIVRRFPGRPMEDQSVRLAVAEEMSKLRRENEELKAELQTLRGGGAALAQRGVPMISLRGDNAGSAPPSVPIASDASPIVPAPAVPIQGADSSTRVGGVSAPMVGSGARTTPTSSGPASRTVQGPATKAPSNRVTPTATPARSAGSGITHTVRPKETLYQISKRYNVRLEDLAAANGIRNVNSVPIGTVLRIP